MHTCCTDARYAHSVSKTIHMLTLASMLCPQVMLGDAVLVKCDEAMPFVMRVEEVFEDVLVRA